MFNLSTMLMHVAKSKEIVATRKSYNVFLFLSVVLNISRSYSLRCMRMSSSSSKISRSIPENGISFSPAGLLTPFHIGASSELKRLGLVKPETVLAGSSGGALAAVVTGVDIDADSALDACCYIASRCRDEGTRSTLRYALDEILEKVLPPDSHEILNSRIASCFVAYTEIVPRIIPHFVNEFSNKNDLIETLRASCNIPFYFNGNNPLVEVRGAGAVDGFFTVNLARFGCPPTGARTQEIIVSPYSAKLVGLDVVKIKELDAESRRLASDSKTWLLAASPEDESINWQTVRWDAAQRSEQELMQEQMRIQSQDTTVSTEDLYGNCDYQLITPDLLTPEQWPFTPAEVFSMSLGPPPVTILTKNSGSGNSALDLASAAPIKDQEIKEIYKMLYAAGQEAVRVWASRPEETG